MVRRALLGSFAVGARAICEGAVRCGRARFLAGGRLGKPKPAGLTAIDADAKVRSRLFVRSVLRGSFARTRFNWLCFCTKRLIGFGVAFRRRVRFR